MQYISTRGAAPVLAFDEVLLAGLARDGGLYVPDVWPVFRADDLRAMAGLSYPELAVRVMTPFLGGTISESDFAAMVTDAYGRFANPMVAPLKELGGGLWLMELFHGPTLAFKDVALQLLGRLFDHVLKRRGERVTIVGATSGDTGSAAIEACRDRAAIDIFMLYPEGRVSEVQRRQMTTVTAANVHNVAIAGTFDDCQDIVKAMFGAEAFRDRMKLSAVNSINWARVMAQTVYYISGALALGAPDRKVAFAVPTGNFGNVYAGYAARQMGLPLDRLVVGSNRNDILTRFFETGTMRIETVEPTLSPSMDIQISSNFERLLFDLYDRDGPAVAAAINEFRKTGELTVGRARWRAALESFSAYRLDDARTLETIRDIYESTGELIDPHTAVGVAAAKAQHRSADVPMVALATAHPAKFPDVVENATGIRPALPAHLADLYQRRETVTRLPNDVSAVMAFIDSRVGARV